MLGPVYCDTSALLKLYVSEPESADVTKAIGGREDLVLSDLALTEIASALSRRVRLGELTPEAARRTHRTVLDTLESAPYQRVEMTGDVHRRAEQLLLTMTTTTGSLRAADALHLALALSAGAASMAVFDVRLAAAARAVGLAVYPA
ncbi:MAG TPA: type II toxin-antitoxin system VapC family toxin [Candidatus Tectomicrobia bacterium]|nr:type II toxin-antitoxin system VapC family toxin [Candidatus Tectomicrobia bacterium]